MHLRAQWVAMRTIGRRIEAVPGRTVGGQPVYSVETVPLVLPRGAHHFRRLVPCSKCGQAVAESRAVRGRSDLQRESAVLCGRCSWIGETAGRRRYPPEAALVGARTPPPRLVGTGRRKPSPPSRGTRTRRAGG